MSNIRLPRAVCAVAAEVLGGSHDTLNALFESCGAPGPPPNLSHGTKWKEWLYRAGLDPNVDSLAVLGGVLEEFMDIGPHEGSIWRIRISSAMASSGRPIALRKSE